MTKTELVSVIAERVKMSKSDVENVLDAYLESITDALKKQMEVRLVGFGTFTTRHREASVARNPQTGQPVQVPASRVVVFRPGKGLKTAVNSLKSA